MHDRLAATTNDPAARQVHQAMAQEFRRRAGDFTTGAHAHAPRDPVLEMYPAAS